MFDAKAAGLGNRTALAVLMVATVAMAGCAGPAGDDAGDGAEDGPSGDDAANCRAQSASTQQATGIQMACQEVQGSGTQQEGFDCQNPDRSAVGVATNMTAGSVTVEIVDAASTTVFERTYDETGEQNESQAIGQGQAGTWTVTAERSDAFEGSYGVQVACSTS